MVLGVSYLSNVGDTRFTPVGPLYDELVKHQAEVILFDPYITRWVERNIEVLQTLDELKAFSNFDACVLATGHDEFKAPNFLNFIDKQQNMLVIDTMNFFNSTGLLLNGKTPTLTIGKGL